MADREAANQANESLEMSSDDVPTNVEVVYPSGIRLLCLTIGLMAVVLMVALDNYILG